MQPTPKKQIHPHPAGMPYNILLQAKAIAIMGPKERSRVKTGKQMTQIKEIFADHISANPSNPKNQRPKSSPSANSGPRW